MFKHSALFRKDDWFPRLCGHPLVAAVNLLLSVGVFGLLCAQPQQHWGWPASVALLLVPGAWLFIASVVYGFVIGAKLLGMPSFGDLYRNLDSSWRSLLWRREGLAVIAMLSLPPAWLYHSAVLH